MRHLIKDPAELIRAWDKLATIRAAAAEEYGVFLLPREM